MNHNSLLPIHQHSDLVSQIKLLLCHGTFLGIPKTIHDCTAWLPLECRFWFTRFNRQSIIAEAVNRLLTFSTKLLRSGPPRSRFVLNPQRGSHCGGNHLVGSLNKVARLGETSSLIVVIKHNLIAFTSHKTPPNQALNRSHGWRVLK